MLGLIVILTGAFFELREQKPVVEVASAQAPSVGGRQALLNASGYVTPRRRATVAAKITGRVTGVFFDEGMHVKRARCWPRWTTPTCKRALDLGESGPRRHAGAIADLQVQLKNARDRTASRASSCRPRACSTPGSARQRAHSGRQPARQNRAHQRAGARREARIGEAQQDVDNCMIRAPFDGIVVSKDAQVGEMVSPISAGGGFTRTGIATIVDMNSQRNRSGRERILHRARGARASR